jgi:hypothetical protein
MRVKLSAAVAFVIGSFVGHIAEVSACTFSGLQYKVSLTADEQRKIRGWFVGWRDGAGIADALVVSESTKGDDKGRELSMERLRVIRNVLDPLKVDGIDIRYGNGIRDEKPEGILAVVLDEVEISIQPACTKTDTCCPVPIGK